MSQLILYHIVHYIIYNIYIVRDSPKVVAKLSLSSRLLKALGGSTAAQI